jgi:hypothetical protein
VVRPHTASKEVSEEMRMMVPSVNGKSPGPDAVIRVRPWTRRMCQCTGRAESSAQRNTRVRDGAHGKDANGVITPRVAPTTAPRQLTERS